MIITKKQFEAALAKVREEEKVKYEQLKCERDNMRWIDERMREIDRRIDNAFIDIDRRLTELEKTPSCALNIPIRPKY